MMASSMTPLPGLMETAVCVPNAALMLPSLSARPFLKASIPGRRIALGLLPHGGKGKCLRVSCEAVGDTVGVNEPAVEEENLPTPVVIIDQESDPDATVVEISFGDRLGALLDTMLALKNLGLNVVKSRISVEGAITKKRFAITRVDTGRKIEDPELLEAIRLTIISNMIEFHPESSALLAMGNAFGIKAPAKLDVDIATRIRITDEGPNRSLLYIETADRPGLLRDIVKVIADVNIIFESGEFDTEGLVAKAKFHVNYRGAALTPPMKQVMSNCFQYYLRRPETNEDSY